MKSTHFDPTAVEIVAETLKQSIERGTLKPGDKLPTQKEMESMYCVSRIVIREAIKILEGKGLLYSRQGSGIYVTEAPLLFEEKESKAKGYTLYEMLSLFEFIFYYACFELKNRKDLSEIQELQKLNNNMCNNYEKLTIHQKFVYEASFGARLVKLSGNPLASDLFLMLVKPFTTIDYMLIVENDLYIDILRIDELIIKALLERDPYKACFWGHERNQKTLQDIREKKEFMEKRYTIFD